MQKLIRTAAHRAPVLGQNVVSVVVSKRVRSSASASCTPGANIFDTDLLAYLVCPLSKGELRYNADKQELVSHEIGVAYPIVAGIPRLIPTAGRFLDTASDISGTNE